jgi:hypothetical protein
MNAREQRTHVGDRGSLPRCDFSTALKTFQSCPSAGAFGFIFFIGFFIAVLAFFIGFAAGAGVAGAAAAGAAGAAGAGAGAVCANTGVARNAVATSVHTSFFM